MHDLYVWGYCPNCNTGDKLLIRSERVCTDCFENAPKRCWCGSTVTIGGVCRECAPDWWADPAEWDEKQAAWERLMGVAS